MNSEDGTVQAGEYAKGDTATFFVYDGEGSVKVRIAWKTCAELLLLFCQRIADCRFNSWDESDNC